MTRNNIEAIYPLSPMQQGLLFHTLYAPQSGVYLVQNCYTLCGDLNVSVFRRAWQYVLERHPILRTIFIWENREKPLQIVYRQVNLPLEQHDWRSLSLAVQQERLESFLAVDRERGFALSKTPPLRLALIQVGKDAYQFILSFHHLLLDGWSVFLLVKEVFACYEAYRRDQQLLLEPSRPYQDYIVWLRQQDLCEAEVFWRQALKDFSAPTPLRVDRGPSSPPGQWDDCGEQEIKLSVAITTALRSFAQHHHLTLNTLIQGAWTVLLSRYSGETDVVFGATVSGRPAALPGVESMVGLFINTLPVRVQASGENSLTAWLKCLQDQQLELRQYEYSPLVQVQEWSAVPRGRPLFESILLFQNYPLGHSFPDQGSSLEVRKVRTIERTHYPLTVVVEPGRELRLRILYHRPCFDAATITRMLGHLQTLLTGIVANPEQRLSEVTLVTEAERHQLLVAWNDTATAYPQDQCMQQLFEAQVERTPAAVAVVYEDRQLTYRELNHRANQLAHHLRALGVGPEVLVGICMERSLEMVIGLLGILKAGGAYVPLDPAYPQERLAFMLADTQAPVLLTQQQLVERLPTYETQIVRLDVDWETIAQESVENPVNGVTADNLAYMIYTSGSTGTPKGVPVPHRAVNRLVCNTNYIQLESSDRVAQASNVSFDAATFEIWGALLHGARLVEITKEVALSPQDFAAQLRERGITVLFLTTALFNLLAREAPWTFSAVRHLLFGGEAVDPRWVKEVLNNGPPRRLLHVYGPTESTTFTSWYLVQEVPERATTIPIGRPIANTQIYLLDVHLQPVPIGVPGELYIGGDGLARGYLNRPELTAEKFISNPFSEEPDARLYKTGDLARYLPTGDVEFLGRLDSQVKLRGFRIELGEIEAVLGQHPGVREAIVLLREDTPGDKRLVGYIVPTQNQCITTSDLSSFLKRKLPEYMVPIAFVLLEAFPLSPNGKVNRQAFPIPSQPRPDRDPAFSAPRTPVEETLADIWAQVLGVEHIGVHDNFFELGGHSLKATQVVSRLRAAFQIELPLRCLFETPTVASLARTVEKIQVGNLTRQAPVIVPLSREARRIKR